MKGFVTLAVGDERYYKLAANLLKSYKYHTDNPMPFAIVADRHNRYTELFDDVVIINNPWRSYMDKIELLNIAPYNENVFIDADSLAYGDINVLWDYYPFDENGGVTCFGEVLPLDASKGWFKIEDIGDYRNQIDFIPDFHGGIMFFGQGPKTEKIYQKCLEITEHYSEYKFKFFAKPADEPIIALSMAVNGCHPIEFPGRFWGEKMFVFYPLAEKVKVNISKGKLIYTRKQRCVSDTVLMHWQSVNTKKALYKTEVDRLNGIGGWLYPIYAMFDILRNAKLKLKLIKSKFKYIKRELYYIILAQYKKIFTNK